MKHPNHIEGVELIPLKRIPDERGMIMHMMRSDLPHFEKFGEIYFSMVYPNVIKGWHIHSKMTLNYAVPMGMIKMVLFDERKDSPTKGKLMELYVGESNYILVKVPPGVWNGFKGIGVSPALVANCATMAHDPEEISRKDPFTKDIPYQWDLKHC